MASMKSDSETDEVSDSTDICRTITVDTAAHYTTIFSTVTQPTLDSFAFTHNIPFITLSHTTTAEITSKPAPYSIRIEGAKCHVRPLIRMLKGLVRPPSVLVVTRIVIDSRFFPASPTVSKLHLLGALCKQFSIASATTTVGGGGDGVHQYSVVEHEQKKKGHVGRMIAALDESLRWVAQFGQRKPTHFFSRPSEKEKNTPSSSTSSSMSLRLILGIIDNELTPYIDNEFALYNNVKVVFVVPLQQPISFRNLPGEVLQASMLVNRFPASLFEGQSVQSFLVKVGSSSLASTSSARQPQHHHDPHSSVSNSGKSAAAKNELLIDAGYLRGVLVGKKTSSGVEEFKQMVPASILLEAIVRVRHLLLLQNYIFTSTTVFDGTDELQRELGSFGIELKAGCMVPVEELSYQVRYRKIATRQEGVDADIMVRLRQPGSDRVTNNNLSGGRTIHLVAGDGDFADSVLFAIQQNKATVTIIASTRSLSDDLRRAASSVNTELAVMLTPCLDKMRQIKQKMEFLQQQEGSASSSGMIFCDFCREKFLESSLEEHLRVEHTPFFEQCSEVLEKCEQRRKRQSLVSSSSTVVGATTPAVVSRNTLSNSSESAQHQHRYHQLGKAILSFAQAKDRGEEYWSIVCNAIAQLEMVIQNEFAPIGYSAPTSHQHPLRVVLFGSCGTIGCWDGESDLDLAIFSHDGSLLIPTNEPANVNLLGAALKKVGFPNTEVVDTARVPIVKYPGSSASKKNKESMALSGVESFLATPRDAASLLWDFGHSVAESDGPAVERVLQSNRWNSDYSQVLSVYSSTTVAVREFLSQAVTTQKLPTTVAFPQAHWYRSVDCRPEMFIPQFDLSFRPQGPRNTLLIRRYLNQCPLARFGYTIIKHWSKQCGINEPKTWLTSYSLQIMWIYYLLVRQYVVWIDVDSIPEIPTLAMAKELTTYVPMVVKPAANVGSSSSAEEIGSAVHKFFEFYATEFDYDQHVITINVDPHHPPASPVGSARSSRGGGIISKKDLGWTLTEEVIASPSFSSPTTKKSKEVFYRLCIQDPYEKELNLGRRINPGKLLKVKLEFSLVCLAIEEQGRSAEGNFRFLIPSSPTTAVADRVEKEEDSHLTTTAVSAQLYSEEEFEAELHRMLHWIVLERQCPSSRTVTTVHDALDQLKLKLRSSGSSEEDAPSPLLALFYRLFQRCSVTTFFDRAGYWLFLPPLQKSGGRHHGPELTQRLQLIPKKLSPISLSLPSSSTPMTMQQQPQWALKQKQQERLSAWLQGLRSEAKAAHGCGAAYSSCVEQQALLRMAFDDDEGDIDDVEEKEKQFLRNYFVLQQEEETRSSSSIAIDGNKDDESSGRKRVWITLSEKKLYDLHWNAFAAVQRRRQEERDLKERESSKKAGTTSTAASYGSSRKEHHLEDERELMEKVKRDVKQELSSVTTPPVPFNANLFQFMYEASMKKHKKKNEENLQQDDEKTEKKAAVEKKKEKDKPDMTISRLRDCPQCHTPSVRVRPALPPGTDANWYCEPCWKAYEES